MYEFSRIRRKLQRDEATERLRDDVGRCDSKMPQQTGCVGGRPWLGVVGVYYSAFSATIKLVAPASGLRSSIRHPVA